MDDYSFEAAFKHSEGNGTGAFEGGNLLLLDINRVHPNPHQPRKQFDQETLDELPSRSRPRNPSASLGGKNHMTEVFAIIAGERR